MISFSPPYSFFVLFLGAKHPVRVSTKSGSSRSNKDAMDPFIDNMRLYWWLYTDKLYTGGCKCLCMCARMCVRVYICVQDATNHRIVPHELFPLKTLFKLFIFILLFPGGTIWDSCISTQLAESQQNKQWGFDFHFESAWRRLHVPTAILV